MTITRSLIFLVVAIVLQAIVFCGAIALGGLTLPRPEAFQAAALLSFMASFIP